MFHPRGVKLNIPAEMHRRGRRAPRISRVLAAATVALVASCAAPPAPPAPPPKAAASPIPQIPPEEQTPPAGRSFSLTMNGYKRDVAKQVYRANPDQLFEGAPPPMLKSIVVLTIRIDSQGLPERIGVLRSNGYKDLEQRAMKSLRD